MEYKYGSFIGDEDPHNTEGAAQMLDYALDRLRDDLLTTEQKDGIIRFAGEALFWVTREDA